MELSVNACSVSINAQSILQNISCLVEEQKPLAIIGPSGSGKTTFLRCIAGLQEYSGEIHLPQNASIGFIDQRLNLFPHLTVFENIAFPLRMRKSSKAEIQNNTTEFLKRFSLEHLTNHFPQELSGGEQQRVAFARTMIYQPNVLLLDEPFASLDAIRKYELAHWLKELLNEGRFITLFVTHDIREARFFAESAMCIINGSMAGIGSWETLESHKNSQIRELIQKQL